VNGVAVTIVGVAAQGFEGIEAGGSTDFWIPLQSRTELNAWGNPPDNGKIYNADPTWWCLRLIGRLAQAGGAEGMIGGQMMDIEAPKNTYGEAEVILLQRMKTGALFEFSAEAGAILAERGDEDLRRMRRFAEDLGLAFQIADDLIDATGDEAVAGKAVGKDAEQGKATFITLRGLEGARREARRLAESAAQALSPYGAAANELQALPFFLLGRAA